MLARLLGLRSEDERDATVAFATLFGVMAAHTLLETARDALFLSKLPAVDLPWAYIVIAVLSLAITAIRRRFRRPLARRATLSVSLLVGATVTAGFRWLVGSSQSPEMVFAFYVWTGLLATTVVVDFWLLIAESLDFGQAKRVFAFIGAGGLVGAVIGAALAGALLELVNPADLLLVAAALLAATAVAPAFFSKGRVRAPTRRPEDRAPDFASFRGDPYLRRLLWVALASSTVLTGVDYVFKAVASIDLAPDQLGPFFARFYTIINGVALLVQLVLAPRALRALGVNGSLLLLPALLLFGSGGFVLTGGLGAVLLMRGADGALRHSLHRTSTEILFVPLAPSVRDRYKRFIEAVGQRGGQAIASVLLLGAAAGGARPVDIGVALVVLSAAWFGATSGIRPHYLELFRANLREGALETHAEVPDLDLHTLEALISALSSHNDHEVTAALDLLASYGKTNLVPALVLYHPSPDVVLRAFSLFSETDRSDVDRLVVRLVDHDDERVRAAALRYSASRADSDVLATMADDASAVVQSTGVVEQIRRGLIDDSDGARLLRRLVETSPEHRRALAFSARHLSTDRDTWVLVELSRFDEPDLAREIARSMGASPSAAYAPALIGMLARRECREDARVALVALGERALDALESALGDPDLTRDVRRHVPPTLARLGTPAAAKVLERRLALEADDVVELQLVRALGKMRVVTPELAVEREALVAKARGILEHAVVLLYWQVAIERTTHDVPETESPASQMLSTLLADKESGALERVFRILKVLDPSEEFEVLLTGLRSADRQRRENGRELLMHVVMEPLRSGISAMLGDGPPLHRLRAAARFYDPVGRSRFERALGAANEMPGSGTRPQARLLLQEVHAACLRDMLLDPSDAVRAVARHRLGELGLGRKTLAPDALRGAGALSALSGRSELESEQKEVSRAG